METFSSIILRFIKIILRVLPSHSFVITMMRLKRKFHSVMAKIVAAFKSEWFFFCTEVGRKVFLRFSTFFNNFLLKKIWRESFLAWLNKVFLFHFISGRERFKRVQLGGVESLKKLRDMKENLKNSKKIFFSRSKK
jgi:hypothetical protein